MMLPELSSQVLSALFGLALGEREWSGGTERSGWRSEVRSGTVRSREPDGSAGRMSFPIPSSGTSGRGVERVGDGRRGSGACKWTKSGTERPLVPAGEGLLGRPRAIADGFAAVLLIEWRCLGH